VAKDQVVDKGSFLSKGTVLVVDDEPIIRELCERALREYRILQAGTCHEALCVFGTEPVDLILTDIMMPGGTGIDLLKQIKILDPNAAVIIMTGFAEKDVILNALKEDADDFINKPLNLLQLRTTVEKALSRKALKEELANIKRADQLKSGFLSLISHKLRTPITGISLFLQNLQRGVFTENDDVMRECVTLASGEADYLGRLVSDLLAFSQVMSEGAELQREECDLNAMASAILRQCREMYVKYEMEVNFNSGQVPLLLFDRAKISFALKQIIDNAFKFSGASGHVGLTIMPGENEVLIVVTDSGIGIPSSELPKVFEKFYQIDPENTGQVRGFGLGLFYARDFIRQHGGSISIESAFGVGTTVTIRLPLKGEE
jgi:signal transduction histidine kinase